MKHVLLIGALIGFVAFSISSSEEVEQLDAQGIQWRKKEVWRPPVVEEIGYNSVGGTPGARNFGWIPPSQVEKAKLEQDARQASEK